MNKSYLALAWILALVACGDAEVGTDLCSGDGVTCDSELPSNDVIDTKPVVAVSPASLTKVTPANSLESIGKHESDSYELLTDRAGTLWEFSVQIDEDPYYGERLLVRTTTLEGDVQQSVVDPPKGPSASERASYLRKVHNSERGPIVELNWVPATCSDSNPCGGDDSTEALAFGSDASMSPERIHWPDAGSWPDYYAQAKGRWTVAWLSRWIEQRDSSFKIKWRQTAIERAQYRTYAEHGDPVALLDSGEFAVLAGQNAEIYKPGGAEELWRIGFDGNVKQRVNMLLTSEAHLVHDTKTRALAAGSYDDGDLRAYRHEGGDTVRSWTFTRTQYNELKVFAASVDRADTLYLLTETGGPEQAKDRVPVLCRVTAEDVPGCFLLEKPAELKDKPLRKMQATGPGIVYVSDGQRVFRYELPSD